MTASAERRARIALIGARGSGKSSVGRRLSQRLKWGFLDADVVLEERAGQSIKGLFAVEGEVGFRQRESALLVELCRANWHVLALGGGVILRPENRTLLRQSAWVVWLTADVDTLSSRLREDSSTGERRPSLTGAADPASPDEIAAVLRIREPLYWECADAVVATAQRTLDAVAEEIVESWEMGQPRLC